MTIIHRWTHRHLLKELRPNSRCDVVDNLHNADAFFFVRFNNTISKGLVPPFTPRNKQAVVLLENYFAVAFHFQLFSLRFEFLRNTWTKPATYSQTFFN